MSNTRLQISPMNPLVNIIKKMLDKASRYHHTSVQTNWADSWNILTRRSWVWQHPSLFPLLVHQCMLHEVITSLRPSNLTVSLCACSVTQGCCLVIPLARKHEAITFCRSKNLGLLLLFPLRHFLSNMAKNKRKRKLKEQDFQKVKLKVGKKLQPAQNTTDTSFKSRSVFIPNQLQKLDNEPTNQRNQTLKVRFSDGYYYLWTVISSIRQPISQNFIYTFNSILGWSTKWVCRGSP